MTDSSHRPLQTSSQRRLVPQLETDVQGLINGSADAAAALTLHVALNGAGKGRMSDTITGYIRGPFRSAVNEVDDREKQFMSIILRIARQIGRFPPRCRKKRDRSVWLSFV